MYANTQTVCMSSIDSAVLISSKYRLTTIKTKVLTQYTRLTGPYRSLTESHKDVKVVRYLTCSVTSRMRRESSWNEMIIDNMSRNWTKVRM